MTWAKESAVVAFAKFFFWLTKLRVKVQILGKIYILFISFALIYDSPCNYTSLLQHSCISLFHRLL